MSDIFRFKQFDVDQIGCAMKINTDGVLLAALVTNNHPKRILDIGTGTGVLSLMMAQRFTDAVIEAVEIEEQAAKTAANNFKNSTFSNRLFVHALAIENFETTNKFDLIISNPPFFVNDLVNTAVNKGVARHTTNHFFISLMEKVDSLLTNNGEFWFVLPIKQAELMIAKGAALGFNVSNHIYLHSDITKQPFRYIIALTKEKLITKYKHFYIYEAEKVYTDEYLQLLKPYFFNY